VRRSFFWKIYLSYAALVVVSAAVIGTLVLGNLRDAALRELRTSLGNNARLVAAMKAASPEQLWSPHMARQLEDVARDTGLHLLLVFANGRPIAEAPLPAGARPEADILSRHEFQHARDSEFGEDIRPLVPDGPPMLLMATPIVHEYEIIGYVRAGLPLDRLSRRQSVLRNRVLAGASLNAFFALGLGFFVARHITRPLARISDVCRRLAAGRLDERLTIARQDEIGVVATTINHMADEVQRRIAEETRERQRLGALLAVMADGVVAVSARQTVAYLNEVAARLLGIDPVASIGRPAGEVLRSNAVLETYHAALHSGERVRREIRLPGHPADIVLYLDATSLRDDTGGPFGVLVVLHDLTEIRRLENVRRAFSANVSHELKTPLTAIGAVIDALLEDEAMDACTQRRFLRKIRDQNERLTRLVQDLLIISRLESDQPLLQLEPVDLAFAAAECAQTFAEIARQKQLTFSTRLPPEPVTVRGNREALRLILNNLLHNAVNYTAPGGRIELTLSSAGGRASVAVSDTGVGISSEHLERIFERFYRVERSRVRNAGGAGLGLSIVKHLTQVLSAQVFVESRPGEGSVFTVQFPKLATSPDVAPNEQSIEAGAGGR
jgi:two-component system phosphate regulon sensor histidine kinase PhoR